MIGLATVRRVNRQFRERDDSHLWPICGAFNVTERAIRQARELARHSGGFTSEYEYQCVLEDLCSRIVNDPKNY